MFAANRYPPTAAAQIVPTAGVVIWVLPVVVGSSVSLSAVVSLSSSPEAFVVVVVGLVGAGVVGLAAAVVPLSLVPPNVYSAFQIWYFYSLRGLFFPKPPPTPVKSLKYTGKVVQVKGVKGKEPLKIIISDRSF